MNNFVIWICIKSHLSASGQVPVVTYVIAAINCPVSKRWRWRLGPYVTCYQSRDTCECESRVKSHRCASVWCHVICSWDLIWIKSCHSEMLHMMKTFQHRGRFTALSEIKLWLLGSLSHLLISLISNKISLTTRNNSESRLWRPMLMVKALGWDTMPNDKLLFFPLTQRDWLEDADVFPRLVCCWKALLWCRGKSLVNVYHVH